MGLSEDEQSRLTIFGNLKLDRIQTETIIGRKISNREWKQIQNIKVKKHKQFEGSKQVKHFRTFWKSIEKSHSLKDCENARSIRAARYNKLYKSVAQEAADIGYRKQFKTNIEDERSKFHFVKSLFQ